MFYTAISGLATQVTGRVARSKEEDGFTTDQYWDGSLRPSLRARGKQHFAKLL